jgi:hypothetical protein
MNERDHSSTHQRNSARLKRKEVTGQSLGDAVTSTLVEYLEFLNTRMHDFYEEAQKFSVRLEPVLRPDSGTALGFVEATKERYDPITAESQMRVQIRMLESTVDALSRGLRNTSARLELL